MKFLRSYLTLTDDPNVPLVTSSIIATVCPSVTVYVLDVNDIWAAET